MMHVKITLCEAQVIILFLTPWR